MDRGLLLGIYCLLIMGASLAGGWLPLLFRLSHTGMQVSMSFVGGAMIGVGLLHLLPHAFFELQDIYPCVWWLLGGFLSMFFIERVFHFHHHDVPPDEDAVADAAPQSLATRTATVMITATRTARIAIMPETNRTPGARRWRGWRCIAPPMASPWPPLSARVDADGMGVTLAGLAVFLVVCLHKPFDSLTLGTLMAVGGQSKRARHAVNLLYALAVPIGVGVFLLGVKVEPGTQRQIIGAALAFAAGTFLCISTSDLLPELQFHAHDRLKLSVALLAGLAVSAVIVKAESSLHDHGAHGDEKHGTQHEDYAH